MLKYLAPLVISSLLISSSTPTSSMITSTDILIQPITLQAREELLLPAGQIFTSDRDKGFATVLVQFENQREQDKVITIESIEIQDSSNGRIYMNLQFPQTIHLRPLEHSANDFHLTNKSGFSGRSPIKAVVTYQIDGMREVLTSAPIEVNRTQPE